ncbi:hypothetical protein [Streptomyces bluensis]|uniref:hypothetical protein n=1 Tax=Streptomyces bluensis TaxID=33897 RepID=UPI0019A91DC6|nr:hypothetical protein [Streptomyces bluensis]GGZ65219.1 hypothetical protein GCM10010344_34660 [Streptomyces bluensis]
MLSPSGLRALDLSTPARPFGSLAAQSRAHGATPVRAMSVPPVVSPAVLMQES